ncbi:hypothetical protein [uncultured Cardiobacterium sp.]|uniref:hypothetical protein n=1 Tax=uncultured Cardiobacterium sp. TaxID=417619 RepID=UPI0026117494|nr:hypothetical protein [uncultured Cardiobacterium sp.]
MKNTIRSLILGLAALITFAHAAANDDPGAVAAAFGSALLNGDADTAISHMQIITPEESEQLKKEMGEAEYQKNVNQLTQQLKNMIVSEAAGIQKTLKENDGKIHVNAGEVTYTNAKKTEAKVVVTMKAERKDGATAEVGSETFTLSKTPQGWKVTPN